MNCVSTISISFDVEKKIFVSLKSIYANICKKHEKISNFVIIASTNLEFGDSTTNLDLANNIVNKAIIESNNINTKNEDNKISK